MYLVSRTFTKADGTAFESTKELGVLFREQFPIPFETVLDRLDQEQKAGNVIYRNTLLKNAGKEAITVTLWKDRETSDAYESEFESANAEFVLRLLRKRVLVTRTNEHV